MKRKKRIPLLATCLILMMTFMTTVNADEGYTTVDGLVLKGTVFFQKQVRVKQLIIS